MSISSRIRNIKARPVLATKSPAKTGTETNLITEDGWIFREQSGKRVDCIRRDDEAQVGNVTQPNLVRRRYPSN
jgi:hypothetical protein